MEKHIEPRVVMLAAECIRQKGSLSEGRYTYHQVSLELSYDGYTIILRDPKVMLTLFFHNKLKAEYRRVSDLEEFYSRVVRMAKMSS